MKIIVGLGNPGDEYKNNRHNTGFMALDAINAELGFNWQTSKKWNARWAKEGDTIYIKPLTYLNNSGQAVEAIMSYYKLIPKKFAVLKKKNADLSEILTVIHDDLDIELTKYKVSVDSRSAGHKGVESIIRHLGTKNFQRIRIGIKTEACQNYPAEKFVLQNFNREEKGIIGDVIKNILNEIEYI